MPPFDVRPDVHAAYRLLVPLPVTVEWPSGPQTLDIQRSRGVAGAYAVLLSAAFPRGLQLDLCRGAAHVRHLYATGRWVKVPSIEQTFLERLVREGRAERLAGPFCQLYRPAYRPTGDHPFPDAFFGWHGETDNLH